MKINSSEGEPPACNISGYVPSDYVVGESDQVAEEGISKDDNPTQRHSIDDAGHWSSEICSCFDDIPSCSVGLLCPCYLFAKNAEFLGSGTFIGPCLTHFILYSIINTWCCLFSDGFIVGLHTWVHTCYPACFPGCFVAFYAFGYRRTLRSKYNLPAAPCGDFVTHFCCHLCAICQEYREIRKRSGGSVSLDLTRTTAPPVQKMDSSSSTKSCSK